MALDKSDLLWNGNRIDSLSTIDKDHFVDTDRLDVGYKEQENIQRNILNQKKIQLEQADLLITKLTEKDPKWENLKPSQESKLWFINNYDLQKWYNLVQKIFENNFWEKFFLSDKVCSTAVYTKKDSSDLVYKVSTKDILKQIYSLIDPDFFYNKPEESQQLTSKINTSIVSIFPKWTVLTPNIFLQKMKISPEIIQQFCNDSWINVDYNQFTDNYELPITYTTQAFAHEVADKTWISFNFDPTEDSIRQIMWDNIATIAYTLWQWLSPENIIEYIDKKFDTILDQIYWIEANPNKIKQFFSSVIHYSKQYNEILDIFWSNNFTFFKNKNGLLDFHVIDPIFANNSISDFSLHKKWDSWNIKNRRDFNIFAYPYIIEKMEKYIES
jgi:hypothetical protein